VGICGKPPMPLFEDTTDAGDGEWVAEWQPVQEDEKGGFVPAVQRLQTEGAKRLRREA
jgi:hypothetical protein